MDIEQCVEEGMRILLPEMTQKADIAPKMEQVEAMCSVLSGCDTTCCLPTGWGKSMVFFALPSIYNLVKGKVSTKLRKDTGSPLVIVTSPLISLMKTHTREAREMGIKAVYLPEPDCDVDCADILFASPEHWTSSAGNEMLQKVKDRVLTLAVDEVHVAPKWGTKEKAFRAAYSRMRDLRSSLPDVPVLAMTATASKKSRLLFQRHLGMHNVHSIVKSPDRGNIYMSVDKVKDSSCLMPLIEELKDKQLAMPRTIVYCKSVTDCTALYQLFDRTLGRHGSIFDHHGRRRCLFAMFFHDTLERKKEVILEDLMDEDGHFRIVIATNSLGMGVNLRGCNRIIHFGVPRDLEDYMQEIGRAGRSGEEAEAHLLYKPVHMLGCNDEIKAFVKNNTVCRRTMLLQSFAPTGSDSSTCRETGKCCDVCTSKTAPATSTQDRNEQLSVRTVSDDDIALLHDTMEILKAQIGGKQYAFGIPVFSPRLIESVTEHIRYIDGIDYIALHLPVIDPRLAVEIFRIVCEVFDEAFECERLCEVEVLIKESYLETLLANVDFTDEFSEEEFVGASDELCDIDSD